MGLEKVTETKQGFKVEGPWHKPIVITFEPTFIRVEAQPENDQVGAWERAELANRRFGFYQYYGLSCHVGKCIAADWQRPEREGEEREPTWLRPWKAKKEATFIGKELHALWKKALEGIDPLVLAVHRQVFASCGRRCCELAMDERLYQCRDIANDIAQYRAAAVAAMNVEGLALARARRQIYYTPEALEIRRELDELRARANQHNLSIRAQLDIVDDDFDLDDLGAMADWRGLFSYSGEPYRSLDRTLMNLPGGIPNGLFCNLTEWELERPYTERLELLAILLLKGGEYRVNAHIFEFAKTPQIKEAMQRVGAHTGDKLNTRRYRDVKQAIDFLADFPERHIGNIVGLADKAIVWHRTRLQEERDREIAVLGGETQAAIPPIPLPETPGVTFLDTVGAICQEGADMDHCISSYAKRAVKGFHFLFHIEHDGDRATAQVDYRGQVVQVHGPRNRRNGAATWGRRILGQWGRQFPEDYQPMIAEEGDDELPF